MAGLDLASDGIAYAQAQSGRLNSAAFHRFGSFPPVDSLEGFAERILNVLDALEKDEALPWAEPITDWRELETSVGAC